eukprot:TRINITY_DN77141_c0_g1_i1.p1 TRINITY_DN77141_c0_g1~~TRINITY_DN77141_c0_g1_i1.p1  ORF type:complete len:387 (+),score=60.35 TRINITY_DN77141_c0_g1_i1:30-1163(+)
MALTDTLTVRIQETEGEFEINNFCELCRLRKLKDKPTDSRYEFCSAPVLIADKKRFSINVSWHVNEEGDITEDSKLGVSVHQVEAHESDISYGHCTVTLLNVDPAKSIVRSFTNYQKFARCVKWGWHTQAAGGMGLTMTTVFDSSNGWLQDGKLRVRARLKVLLDNDMPKQEVSRKNPLQELAHDFGALFTSGSHTDVTLAMPDGEIQAHSQILRARSPVFAAMFDSPMKESNERKVSIQGLDKAAVNAMVKFLYTGRPDPSSMESDSMVLDLLQAAHRYQVSGLVEMCVQHLTSHLAVETVSDWVQLADLISCATLKSACMDFIRSHISEVQATESYAALAAKRPALIVELVALFFPPAKRHRTTGQQETGDGSCG